MKLSWVTSPGSVHVWIDAVHGGGWDDSCLPRKTGSAGAVHVPLSILPEDFQCQQLPFLPGLLWDVGTLTPARPGGFNLCCPMRIIP